MGLAIRISKKVKGFSLDVEWEIGNEVAVLFGYSGAGKSMTLQSIAGTLKPDYGFIRLGGRVYYDSSRNVNEPPRNRPFGYVFQDLALFPHMTVEENIAYGVPGMCKDECEEKCKGMISLFHLDGLEKKLPSEISGGQKQRVALARALMRRPEMLLLDEPFSALDYPLRVEMGKLLREIHEAFEIPVVLVTHDISEAYALADRMIIYADGRVAQSGSCHDLFRRGSGYDAESLVQTLI